MSILAIMEGGRLIAQVIADNADSAGIDMTGRTAVKIDRVIDEAWESVASDGAIVADLGKFDVHAKAIIDRLHEQRITLPGPAKSAEHARKLIEAKAVVEGAEAGPMIAAEAQAIGGTTLDLANSIIARDQDATVALAAVCARRRKAIIAIREAPTIAAKKAALETYVNEASE